MSNKKYYFVQIRLYEQENIDLYKKIRNNPDMGKNINDITSKALMLGIEKLNEKKSNPEEIVLRKNEIAFYSSLYKSQLFKTNKLISQIEELYYMAIKHIKLITWIGDKHALVGLIAQVKNVALAIKDNKIDYKELNRG